MERMMRNIIVGAWAMMILAAAASAGATAGGDPVFQPMEQEMMRSLASLKQDGFGPPYFLAYRLIDARRWQFTASFGSAVQDASDDSRVLYVEARYGDRALDNTDLSYQGLQGPGPSSPESLRQALWALTDGAYKSAVAGYLEKKAKRATERIPDVLDDFSVEVSTVHLPAQPAEKSDGPDRQALRGLVERLSAVMRGFPHVYDSQATLQLKTARRYLLTSEGARLATEAESLPGSLGLSAATRAEDGMRLDGYRSWALRDAGDIPPEAELAAAAEKLALEVGAMRRAPVQSPLAAPAILDSEFTGVLFHEALGHKLEGQRQRDPQDSQIFKDMPGKRIIPEFLSVFDDPTLSSFKGKPLGGTYEYDSEGVAARRVVLVERGILRNFLMSRWPVKGFPSSNGHGRADAYRHPTGRMSNLIVTGHDPVGKAALKEKLMSLARKAGKPYGFRLVGSVGGENPTYRASAQTLEVRPRLIYRVDAKTGEETLVRGVKLVGTPIVFLNRIVAAGDDVEAATGFICGAESGYVPVSQVAPSVLVSEAELQRLPEDRSRPPILASPFHEKGQ
jgi:predicted Zn-dependent protease